MRFYLKFIIMKKCHFRKPIIHFQINEFIVVLAITGPSGRTVRLKCTITLKEIVSHID